MLEMKNSISQTKTWVETALPIGHVENRKSWLEDKVEG